MNRHRLILAFALGLMAWGIAHNLPDAATATATALWE